MTEKERKRDAAPKSAAEVDDKALDQAAGGAGQAQTTAFVVTFDRPIDPASKDPDKGGSLTTGG